MRKIVNEELATHEAAVKETINSSLKTTNEHIDKVSGKMGELKINLTIN